jgi:hypothetical protein
MTLLNQRQLLFETVLTKFKDNYEELLSSERLKHSRNIDLIQDQYQESLKTSIEFQEKRHQEELSALQKRLERSYQEKYDALMQQQRALLVELESEREGYKNSLKLQHKELDKHSESMRLLELENISLKQENERLCQNLEQEITPLRKVYLEREIVHLFRYKTDLESQIQEKQRILENQTAIQSKESKPTTSSDVYYIQKDTIPSEEILEQHKQQLDQLNKTYCEAKEKAAQQEQRAIYYSSTLAFLKQSIGTTLRNLLWCSWVGSSSNSASPSNSPVTSLPSPKTIQFSQPSSCLVDSESDDQIEHLKASIQEKTEQLHELIMENYVRDEE